MSLLDSLGWLAAAVGMSSVLPQLIRLVRVRTSAGLSTRMWQLNVACSAAWAAHGFLVGHPQLQWPNVFFFATSLAVLVMIIRDRHGSLAKALVLPVAVWAILFAVDQVLGEAVFGLLVATPVMAGQIAQLRAMRAAKDLSGVSPIYLGQGLLVQLLWLSWGLPTGEWAITVCATLTGALFATLIGYWTYRTRRVTQSSGA